MRPYWKLRADIDALRLYLEKHPPADPHLRTFLTALLNTLSDYGYNQSQINVPMGD